MVALITSVLGAARPCRRAARFGVDHQSDAPPEGPIGKFFREIIEIADDSSGNYITTSDGKRIVDHESIQRSRLRVDARKWAAARLAPKKYGGQMTHDIKGTGLNFQPAILIKVGGEPPEELVSSAPETGDGVLLEGNGDIVRGSGRRR